MMILDLILDCLLGLILHQTRKYTAKLPHGWSDITNHAVGVVGTSPAFVLWYHRLKGVEDKGERAFLAYFLAFTGVGSGVALGWLFDTFFSPCNDDK